MEQSKTVRSYINSKGDSVRVSQEHLDTAVEIKIQLQKASPSRRCSWVQHKKLMQKEGFLDSDRNENYRVLIKNYQKKIGKLPSREKHADIVSTSKLESIKEAVGDLYYAKREAQLENLKLGRIKRDVTLRGIIAESFQESLNNGAISIPLWAKKEKLQSEKTKMVVFLQDWHIGAIVDNVYGNSFNYEIACKRVERLYQEVYRVAKEKNITDITVMHLGDIVEQVMMRKYNQAFETEFHLSEQIVKAKNLLINFLTNLSSDFNVFYTGLGGNHDRLTSESSDTIDGDSAMLIINDAIESISKQVERISYIPCDDICYSSVVVINDTIIKGVHGDKEKKAGKLKEHSAFDHVTYNIIAQGHFHSYSIQEVGINQYEAQFGSLMGVNNYGTKGKFGSKASQGLAIIGEDHDIQFMKIDLQ